MMAGARIERVTLKMLDGKNMRQYFSSSRNICASDAQREARRVGV